MARRGFDLIYDAEVAVHLSCIPKKCRSLIRRSVEEMLSFEPEKEAKNRKPLVGSSLFDMGWELRCGARNEFRVFYRTDNVKKEVYILAIGVKKRDKLIIGKEEVAL
ncbi:MAG: type II toxin-antitoxin system RelE/ParE family toxin [Deltaproteobacteria bacterium]|nr:type II toxin-antitoxin system RelE/ParE family toxin [Deltaproteobacteria bacterium]